MIQLLAAWKPVLPPLSEEGIAAEQAQMMAADAQVPQASKKIAHTLLTALLCGHYPLLTAAVFAPRRAKN